jgi:hypothetical protein
MYMSRRLWGWHASLNLSHCGALQIRSAPTIHAFSKTLVKRIDMVPYGEPMIVRFGTGDKAGYTLTQLIETSNIMAHFSEDLNACFLDVFSCKVFNAEDVESVCREYFQPAKIETQFVERGAYTLLPWRAEKPKPFERLQ